MRSPTELLVDVVVLNGKSKVYDFDLEPLADQDVLHFQIPVSNIFIVNVLQSL